MAQTSELTTEGYHQHRESPVGNNYEETLGYAAALGKFLCMHIHNLMSQHMCVFLYHKITSCLVLHA